MKDHSQLPFYRRRHFRRTALWAGIPALAVGLAFAPRAFAGPPCGGMHGGHHGPMGAESVEDLQDHMHRQLDHLFGRLDATDAQRLQATQVVDTAAPELYALKEKGRELRNKLKQALLAQQIDQAQVEAVGDEIQATLGEATRVGVATMGKVAAVLDAEQRTEVADMLAHFGR